MNKIALLLTSALIAGIAAVNLAGTPAADALKLVDDDRIVQQKVANYRCFKDVLEASLDGLRTRRISLAEAHTRVRSAAQRYRPEFLEMMISSDAGDTDDERLARNLIGHVRSEMAAKPGGARRVSELEAELEVFLRH